MGAQIHRSTITDWMVRLHVAIQAFNHKLFAELSSRMGAETLPIDDGAPEATCAFAVHIIHGKSDGTNGSIWSRSKHFVMEVTSSFFAIQSSWKLLHSRAVRGVRGAPQGYSRYLAHGRRYGR